jgi:hypothetical protein
MTSGDHGFGTLKHVSLRKVWAREAADFTPWLAQHLSALSEVLGVELELQSREAPVGDFSLDILARDLSRNRPVIIENQLSPTNHDHFGKLLTYAAGYDASMVIWIAEEMREEHRQALDWLNQHMDTTIDFFGIVIEVLQIDDSPHAFNFKLVASPNEWRKRNITLGGDPVSARGELYRAFFQGLIDDLRARHFTGARVAQPQSWYTFASGVTGCLYGASFAQGRQVRAELYLNRSEAEVNKALFDRLAAAKREIESEFGEALSGERLEDRQASRIAVYRSGSIDDDAQTREDIKHWLIDRLVRFKRVFGPQIVKPTTSRGAGAPTCPVHGWQCPPKLLLKPMQALRRHSANCRLANSTSSSRRRTASATTLARVSASM